MDFCCLIYVLTDTGLNGPLRLAGSPIFVDTVKKKQQNLDRSIATLHPKTPHDHYLTFNNEFCI